ncbi:serine hydrolase domain-containing protein [Aquimarina sp. 2201CG14-23]|uniref:serine hydrolase domain-containing protein n=1 Tax=Aquimarina mycalae TaxID=3040073 RepID=UPI0024781A1B|nr:serine hydrolase [Aquimarina sp. 2201CG14-23]MDH7446281.1 serine hydrolase [Aquimarina sp. 2201CG14-23]
MKRFKKILGFVFIGFVGLILIAAFWNYPKLTILSGYSAKNMASSVFIGNRSVEFTDINDNNFVPVHLADDKVNVDEKFSVASVFGLKERKAIYREGLGSVLIDDSFDIDVPYLKPKRNKKKINVAFPYGDLPQKDTVFDTVDYHKIDTTVSSVFDKEGESIKKTRAVLVIHKNQIIAEKYADGLDENSILLGWSMTKSVLATNYGVLQKQGRININEKAPIKAWQNDPRKEITIHNLLQMNCGLAWDEDYGSISDATKMLYIEKDMTLSQIDKEAIRKPNEYWYYSSGVSNLLSGILRKQFDSYQEYLDFPYREFIDKIGMHSMLIETDMAGNYVGSSYAWATVRDWAKFGLLYLHKGNWNGEQIFDPSWVDYVTTPSPTSEGDYGGHFWLNAGGFYPDAPRDMFSANGFQGQRVFIVPSKDLVIVRFGLIGDAGMDFNTFLKEIVAAIN